MEFKLTARDRKLLLFLAGFLITVGFVRFLLMPGAERYQELKMEIEDQQKEKEHMEEVLLKFPMMQKDFEIMKEESKEAFRDYYPVMTSQEIDRLLTGMVVSRGLEALNLSIGMNDTQGLALPMYVGAEPLEGGEETEEQGFPSGLSCASVSLNVAGEKGALLGLLDELITENPGIHVSNYSISERMDAGGVVIGGLGISMYVYMYQEVSVE